MKNLLKVAGFLAGLILITGLLGIPFGAGLCYEKGYVAHRDARLAGIDKEQPGQIDVLCVMPNNLLFFRRQGHIITIHCLAICFSVARKTCHYVLKLFLALTEPLFWECSHKLMKLGGDTLDMSAPIPVILNHSLFSF